MKQESKKITKFLNFDALIISKFLKKKKVLSFLDFWIPKLRVFFLLRGLFDHFLISMDPFLVPFFFFKKKKILGMYILALAF